VFYCLIPACSCPLFVESRAFRGYSVECLHEKFRRNVLHPLTQASARNPRLTIFSLTLFSFGILFLGLSTNFRLESDAFELWTPVDSPSIRHREWIERESGFPDPPRTFYVLLHRDGGNVLDLQSMGYLFDVLDTVRNLPGYASTCTEYSCEIHGACRFWDFNSTYFHSIHQSHDDLVARLSSTKYDDGVPVREEAVFGFPERNATNQQLVFVKSLPLLFQLPNTQAAFKFEEGALRVVENLAATLKNDIHLEMMAKRSYTDEYDRAIMRDVPLVPIGFCIMSTFTAVVFWCHDKVKSRALLGLGAVFAVTLSIVSSYGLLFCIGISFSSVAQIMPFVLFGIGLDDSFVIMRIYRNTDPASEISDRIGATVDEIGTAITLTTLTSALAFGLGCLSHVKAIRWLCMYALPAVILVYLFQLTFFVACIVDHENCIIKKRRDSCLLELPVWEIAIHQYTRRPPLDAQSEEKHGLPNINISSLDTAQNRKIDKFMNMYTKVLLRPQVKVAVVLIFAVLAISCGYSVAQMTQHFNDLDILPEDSYVSGYMRASADFLHPNVENPYVYFRDVRQSDETVQMQMEDYVGDLATLEQVSDEPIRFWLEAFKSFVHKNVSLQSLPFQEQLDHVLALPEFSPFLPDIVRDDNHTIVASRLRISLNIRIDAPVQDKIRFLKDQRRITAEQDINRDKTDWAFFTFANRYGIWELYSDNVSELVNTTIFGMVSVTGVAALFIPHWTASLFVLPLMFILYIDLLGMLQWGGVHINPVSFFTMAMSIGLLVDFVLHPLHRYYDSFGNRHEKTVRMLRTIGPSILTGGVSTLLGTLPLAFSSSSIFRTIFLAFMALSILGMGHGLILLPVLLSTFGPEDQTSSSRKSTCRSLSFEMVIDVTSNRDNDSEVSSWGSRQSDGNANGEVLQSADLEVSSWGSRQSAGNANDLVQADKNKGVEVSWNKKYGSCPCEF